MAIYNKPDENVFASSAKQGEVNNFPDIGRGWGISFDQTGGVPPMEWFNFLFKRTDEKFGYILQRGISEWSETQEYPVGALVQYKNLTYKAKRANTNKNPEQANSQDWQRWGFAQSELKSATLTESGITQLLTSVNSDDETTAATPRSVKTAYDKGVEAKTAADDANNNANGRVSKTGDVINGNLFIDGVKPGGFANGLIIRNKAGGQNTSGFIDFFQSDAVPRSSIWFRDVGNNSTQIEFLNTHEGADWNRDSRQGVFTITSSGNLWSRQYGWLHEYFAKQSDNNNIWNELNNTFRKSRFATRFYQNHYSGSQVFDIPVADNGVMRIITMIVSLSGETVLNLPERISGWSQPFAVDVGSGRYGFGAQMIGNNQVRVYAGNRVDCNILVIGYEWW